MGKILEIFRSAKEKRNSETVLTKRIEIRLVFIDEDIDKWYTHVCVSARTRDREANKSNAEQTNN